MAAYGQIKIKHPARGEEHTLSFSDKNAWFQTDIYIRRTRPDLVIVDTFWGYALYSTKDEAIETINAFAPEA